MDVNSRLFQIIHIFNARINQKKKTFQTDRLKVPPAALTSEKTIDTFYFYFPPIFFGVGGNERGHCLPPHLIFLADAARPPPHPLGSGSLLAFYCGSGYGSHFALQSGSKS
jgi:hypothetical protein